MDRKTPNTKTEFNLFSKFYLEHDKKTNKIMPIGPRLAYNYFSSENKNKVYEMEVAKNRQPKPRNLLMLVKRAYSKLSDEQRQKYLDLAQKDKERYQRQLKEFEAKGFFTLEDGRKSSEIKNASSEMKSTAPGASKRKASPMKKENNKKATKKY